MKKLSTLWERLVHCGLNCEWITNNPKKGIIPRCLHIEKRKGKRKCIVVGLNPGKCNLKEREFYLENGIHRNSVQKFFEQKLSWKTPYKSPYFKRAREMISKLWYDGTILWTDLVKCECSGPNGSILIQTLRVCVNKFLRKEIEIFKSNVIFTLGNKAFDFCSLSFPNHFVVWLPHSSWSYGDFLRLMKNVNKSSKAYMKILAKPKDKNGNYKALKLSEIR